MVFLAYPVYALFRGYRYASLKTNTGWFLREVSTNLNSLFMWRSYLCS